MEIVDFYKVEFEELHKMKIEAIIEMKKVWGKKLNLIRAVDLRRVLAAAKNAITGIGQFH